MSIARIYINNHKLRSFRDFEEVPCISLRHKKTVSAFFGIHFQNAKIRQNIQRPISCGARVWVELDSEDVLQTLSGFHNWKEWAIAQGYKPVFISKDRIGRNINIDNSSDRPDKTFLPCINYEGEDCKQLFVKEGAIFQVENGSYRGVATFVKT